MTRGDPATSLCGSSRRHPDPAQRGAAASDRRAARHPSRSPPAVLPGPTPASAPSRRGWAPSRQPPQQPAVGIERPHPASATADVGTPGAIDDQRRWPRHRRRRPPPPPPRPPPPPPRGPPPPAVAAWPACILGKECDARRALGRERAAGRRQGRHAYLPLIGLHVAAAHGYAPHVRCGRPCRPRHRGPSHHAAAKQQGRACVRLTAP